MNGSSGAKAAGIALPSNRKQSLRSRFRSLRAEAVAEAGPMILQVARRELPALLPPDLHLGLYWPLPGEPDLRPLATLHPLLALPAISADPPELQYRPWQPGSPLAVDRYGIPTPPPPVEAEAILRPPALGLLLVPALSFDPRRGIRLGYGGGWYDRLRADPGWAAVPALAVLPSSCLSNGLPADAWDVPFQGWLDELGVHRIPAASMAQPPDGTLRAAGL